MIEPMSQALWEVALLLVLNGVDPRAHIVCVSLDDGEIHVSWHIPPWESAETRGSLTLRDMNLWWRP
jgi:hypothetical protein